MFSVCVCEKPGGLDVCVPGSGLPGFSLPLTHARTAVLFFLVIGRSLHPGAIPRLQQRMQALRSLPQARGGGGEPG